MILFINNFQKYVLFFAVVIFCTECNSQEILLPETCNCKLGSFTLSEPDNSANIHLGKDGFRVMTLNYPYGEDNENSIFFYEIESCDNGWLKIKVPNADGDMWIEPERLAITSRVNNFKLYSNSNREDVVYTSTVSSILTIMGCEGKWALVYFMNENGDKIQGWISPEEQCDNPYSSCS